jgi:hypothetical protein
MATQTIQTSDAIEKGDHDGRDDVASVLQEHGLATVLATLVDGASEWDEPAINAQAFEQTELPEQLRDTYYRAYAKGAKALVWQLATESYPCHACGEPTTRTVLVRGTNAGKSFDDCPNGHRHYIVDNGFLMVPLVAYDVVSTNET